MPLARVMDDEDDGPTYYDAVDPAERPAFARARLAELPAELRLAVAGDDDEEVEARGRMPGSERGLRVRVGLEHGDVRVWLDVRSEGADRWHATLRRSDDEDDEDHEDDDDDEDDEQALEDEAPAVSRPSSPVAPGAVLVAEDAAELAGAQAALARFEAAELAELAAAVRDLGLYQLTLSGAALSAELLGFIHEPGQVARIAAALRACDALAARVESLFGPGVSCAYCGARTRAGPGARCVNCGAAQP